MPEGVLLVKIIILWPPTTFMWLLKAMRTTVLILTKWAASAWLKILPQFE